MPETRQDTTRQDQNPSKGLKGHEDNEKAGQR